MCSALAKEWIAAKCRGMAEGNANDVIIPALKKKKSLALCLWIPDLYPSQ